MLGFDRRYTGFGGCDDVGMSLEFSSVTLSSVAVDKIFGKGFSVMAMTFVVSSFGGDSASGRGFWCCCILLGFLIVRWCGGGASQFERLLELFTLGFGPRRSGFWAVAYVGSSG